MTGRAYQARLPANALRSESILFTQTAGDGVYTHVFQLPAGAYRRGLMLEPLEAWNSTAAVMDVGDDDDPDGFIAGFNLLNYSGASGFLPGNFNDLDTFALGVYVGGAPTSTVLSGGTFRAAASTVTATITQTGAGATGRTRLTLTYSLAGSNAVKV